MELITHISVAVGTVLGTITAIWNRLRMTVGPIICGLFQRMETFTN